MIEFLIFLAKTVNFLISIYVYILIASIILSWIRIEIYPITDFIHQVTDPVFNFIRNLFPFLTWGGIDFSPIVVFLGILYICIPIINNFFIFLIRVFIS